LVLYYKFAVVHFDLILNIFVMLCKYSRTRRMKLLTWCRVVSQAGLFGSGWAWTWSLSKYFGLILGLHTKHFYSIRSNDFFFRDVDLLCSLW